jgi:organic radical activating enzyme
MICKIENDLPKNLLIIEFMLGNLCNYKCNYCFPGSNEGDKPWPNIDILKSNIKHLLDYYTLQGKDLFHFYLVGGETTLWKDLTEFCSFLKSNYNTNIELSTNATRKIDWWNTNGNYFDQIGISVHHEQANISHIIEVADLLYEKNCCLCVDVLMDPFNFDKCTNIVTQLQNSKHQWPIVAKTVHYNGKHKYTPSQLEYFNDQVKRYPNIDWFNKIQKSVKTHTTITYKNSKTAIVSEDNWLIKNNLNNFKGWTCNLGIDTIKIFSNGDITGNCQQHLYGLDYNYNLYSNDFSKIFNPKFAPVTCLKSICPCPRETITYKVHNDA